MQNIEFGIKMVVNTVFVIFLISYDGPNKSSYKT